MISVVNTILDEIPGERFFKDHLQTPLTFIIGNKTLRKGKLIIFKRSHYFIQITILNHKNQTETFEIPIPYKTEHYPEEGLMYFDYRVKTLAENSECFESLLKEQTIKNSPSQFFNKILEIQIV